MDAGASDWQPADFYMSASQAAKFIGVGIRWFNRLVERREISIDGYVDGDRRFLRSRLEAYVTRKSQSSALTSEQISAVIDGWRRRKKQENAVTADLIARLRK